MDKKVKFILLLLIPMLCSILLASSVKPVLSAVETSDYKPVGGTVLPVNDLGLLIPWIGLMAMISIVAVAASLKARDK